MRPGSADLPSSLQIRFLSIGFFFFFCGVDPRANLLLKSKDLHAVLYIVYSGDVYILITLMTMMLY